MFSLSPHPQVALLAMKCMPQGCKRDMYIGIGLLLRMAWRGGGVQLNPKITESAQPSPIRVGTTRPPITPPLLADMDTSQPPDNQIHQMID